MPREGRYASPGDFRQALNDKLKNVAEESRWNLPQLQRQMAYDRLLERLYLVDDRWIVKGATALLIRDIGLRATTDIDLYLEDEFGQAESGLLRAASKNLDDWFRFEVRGPRSVHDGGTGFRYSVSAYVGVTVWAEFHVDLVGPDIQMTGAPEAMPALARVAMPDIEQHGYRVYPLVDHIADKVVATFDLYGKRQMPSTRYKDLVDLVAIIGEVSIDAVDQQVALRAERNRRGVTLPAEFEVPNRNLWEPGYSAEADKWALPVASTLDEALAVVQPCLNPLLNGTAFGKWDPRSSRWV